MTLTEKITVRLGALARGAVTAVGLVWNYIKRAVLVATVGLSVVVLVGNFLFSTPRDKAVRGGHPLSDECRDSPQSGWTILAQPEIGNDEANAVAQDVVWARRLACSVQTHAISAGTNEPSLSYHLAFLEYGENGDPFPLATTPSAAPGTMNPSQLTALLNHLSQRASNYVVVFIHGWRHDSSIGDGNVADLRVYAAHAARFVAERQVQRDGFPRMEVTAVFVGWPGARVDERRIVRLFAAVGLPEVGYKLASVAAGITLFDRKPVSEAVGPGALSALRAIDRLLEDKRAKNPETAQRMITFGHSLGGNMLATALRDHLVKRVGLHVPGSIMQPEIGDAVVLINPASEAANWTALQRAVSRRIAMRIEDGDMASLVAGHRFFPQEQKPVMISVTAARDWPPGGIRQSDCAAAATNPPLRRVITESRNQADRGIEYDMPTHDLFPAFRFDFRPVADSLTRWAQGFAEEAYADDPCVLPQVRPIPGLLVRPVFWLANALRYFPFINTDQEQTRTIGHLEAPRPSEGSLVQYRTSERPFGTTHELIGLHPARSEVTLDYRFIGSHPRAACAPATGWLLRARQHKDKAPFGSLWDSRALAPLPEASGSGVFNRPAAQFVHGFVNTGRAAITRANDPFWNMRAYDNALARHDGYLLSSFICAMQQFVLDDITATPPTVPPGK
jgi:hypothetical protein